MQGPVRLDGASGEGGGQILRMAAALSVRTGRSFTIERIRHGRPKPGLRAQHAGVLRFLAAATGGTVENAVVGATEVSFIPGPARAGRYFHDIGTAGSVMLFLQAVLPVYLTTRGTTEITVRGGTDVPFSPAFDWYTGVHVPYVAPLVHRLEVEVVQRGIDPKGGGEVRVRIENPDGPEDLDDVRAQVAARLGAPHTQQGNLRSLTVSSIAARELADAEVAERQADGAATVLRRHLLVAPQKAHAYVDTRSTGSAVTACGEDDLGNRLGGDALGARGVRAEAVGHRAAGDLVADWQTGATVDRWMADQVVPWIALGAGPVRVPRITGHLETNIETCRAFLGAPAVRLDGDILRQGP